MVQWRGRRESRNVIDQRGTRYSGGAGGGGGGLLALLPLLFRIFGWKGAVLAVIIVGGIGLFSGGIDSALNNLTGGTSQPATIEGEIPAGTEEAARFAAVMLADTEEVWNEVFAEAGQQYREPKLVLFSDAVSSACGFAQSAMGPFYCPADERVYIDVRFYDELAQMGAGNGDFAQAYVLAHEVGHHVENLLGILDRADAEGRRGGGAAANLMQVRVELMADCFAGLWAARADQRFNLLEPGDIDEGMAAAAAVGDDTIQRRAGRSVVPDSFTHGSAAQRQRWFMRGFNNPDVSSCDTFSAREL
ncbi:neutral zinc metallopeptidase [uncultured Maricaulis sp.]|uniref:KPN_02809 family neutral zinc metallopeptidase n=1 Tax=uncultured Maricaulis sp. TaxID=174710 RepID=UPI0030DAE94F|tara:strand:- start:9386 stop:10297 length:912 start_codon:yes stop_codon:yes gene_type:complete